MRKFIKTIIVYFMIVGLIVFGIDYCYQCKHNIVGNNASDNTTSTEKYQRLPKSIDICNLGSSHALWGFNYETISKEYSCFNFALNAQSLSYDKQILQYYNEHLHEDSLVFITVSYYSIVGIDETDRRNFKSANMRYYDFLPPDLIKDYNIPSHLLRSMPSLTAYEFLAYTLLSNGVSEHSSDSVWYDCAEDIDIANNVDYTFSIHYLDEKTDVNGNLIYNQTEIDAIYEIISICKEIGATPVLITTPYLSEYLHMVDERLPDFTNNFYKIINKITKDTGVEYYDYSSDSRFISDYSLFRDCDHLNIKGSRLFSSIIYDEIIKRLLQ